ncbi:hypothetical protein N7513_001515 [Penicillium frequentans]|nr:hypothetical protein N7513_001515 [Penicillium glabrum]
MLSTLRRRRKSLPLLALALASLTSGVHAIGSRCSSGLAPKVSGALVISTTAEERLGNSDPISGETISPDVCEVTVTLSHLGENDKVNVYVSLPLKEWNGRFQALGGGGFAMRQGEDGIHAAVSQGYAAAHTDGGFIPNSMSPETWALDSEGNINWSLFLNFASRSLHDLAVVGKSVSTSFYGKPPKYSYWNGCSTGGRQGYMEAQKYPEDFDGIMANAPAINWHKFIPAEIWGQVVMNQEQVFPTRCEYSAFVNASIAACDSLDGVVDGVIENQDDCRFDPFSLVGSVAACDGTSSTITEPMAALIEKLHQGPRSADGSFLWYGLAYGTYYDETQRLGLAMNAEINGKRVGIPFPITENWTKFFIKRDPTFNISTLTYSDYEDLFADSAAQYHDIIGTDNPDLSAFRQRGGKLLTWHGVGDTVIFPEGTTDYYNRVKDTMSGVDVDEFYRLFLAPGVGHCEGGAGPVPVDPLSKLVAWVEEGKAPDTMPAKTTNANGATVSRNLCQFPLVSLYDGQGDPNLAKSYTCASHFAAKEPTLEMKDEL